MRSAAVLALTFIALACGPRTRTCPPDLEYDPARGTCICLGTFVCETPDVCECRPADAGVSDGAPADATPDAGPMCGEGETRCRGACVDTTSSTDHCGRCGEACSPGTLCADGDCVDGFIDIAAGHRHACAVRSSGTVWCWGVGTQGQLGNGALANSLVPVQVVGLDDVTRVESSSQFNFDPDDSTFTCALRSDSTIWCWGDNDRGQLGDRTRDHRAVPVQAIGVAGVRDFDVGSNFVCAVLEDRTVSCWGDDQGAQMGHGTAAGSPQLIPGAVPDAVDSEDVALALAVACSRTRFRTVECWGTATSTEFYARTVIPGAAPATAIAASLGAHCVLDTSGAARCWGDAWAVGTPGADPIAEPALVPDLSPGLRSIEGGADSFCVADDAGVVCWDSGTGSPARVDGAERATDLTVGAGFACIIVAGQPMCWGANENGQLGNGTTTPSAIPVPIEFGG